MLHPEAGGPPRHLQVSETGGVLLLSLSVLPPTELHALTGLDLHIGTVHGLKCSL